jgi:hypothetical protein
MPTTVVLAFDQPLDPTTAEDVHNDVIIDPNGQRIAIDRAVYDPARQAVTLHSSQRISIHYPYGLTVKGKGTSGVRNTAGRSSMARARGGRAAATTSCSPGGNWWSGTSRAGS